MELSYPKNGCLSVSGANAHSLVVHCSGLVLSLPLGLARGVAEGLFLAHAVCVHSGNHHDTMATKLKQSQVHMHMTLYCTYMWQSHLCS